MEKVRNVINWIWWSSVNSEKISLTLKALVPFLVLWGVSDTVTLNHFVGLVGELVINIAKTISLAIAILAFARKIYYSY